ncbi:MAG: hypothetical protein ACRD0K_19420 [Egibacteraceae bacterium]
MSRRRDLLDLERNYADAKKAYREAKLRGDRTACRELSNDLDEIHRALVAAKEADRG